MFNPNLRIGEVINNTQLMTIFKCGMMGGMRRSKQANSLVIVSDHTKGIYEDHWEGEILHYTGMGKIGDQDLYRDQNKTLLESDQTGISVFLFEVIKATEYIYLGPVRLVQEPYQDKQPDDNGDMRMVWVFPVRPILAEEVELISDKLVEALYYVKQKKARNLSDAELEKRAKLTGKEKLGSRRASSNVYERNAYVSEYVKRKAKGVCQLCNQPAPFKDVKGQPYLESHHIVWLSKGGEDAAENSVALCPNCHRKMHVLDLESDRVVLKKD